MNWFKKQKETRLEQLNSMIAIIQKEEMLEEYYGADSGRKLSYIFIPLITENSPECFTLNPASVPIIVNKCNHYVNRVLIPENITKTELRKLMKEMKSHYQQSRFNNKNQVTSVQFGYQTQKGPEYTRHSETPGFYEIRLCAKGYPNDN